MENNYTEMLLELEAALAEVKERVLALEQQLAACKEAMAAEPEAAPEVDFTDMEFGVEDIPAVEESPAAEAPVADIPDFEEPVEDLPEPEPVAVPEPAEEPEPQAIPAAEEEPVPAPVPAEEPAPVPAAEPKPDTSRMAWRLDTPGMSVKNIRSGISLYDRALFIGTLFKEDYALYDKTIGDLNAMTSLDEAVDYLLAAFPDWNLKSDIVYNFIMAVRKKIG